MTKRFTITMVALVVFCLCLVALPVSAMQPNPVTGKYNGSVITSSPSLATIFIGESGLNIGPALCQGTCVPPAIVPAGYSTKIGWWAPGTFSFPANPSQIIDVGTSYSNFEVSAPTFGSYTGTWYALKTDGAGGTALFTIADPYQAVTVIHPSANSGTGQDTTGQTVVRGTVLTFKLDTNLAAFTSGGRASPIITGIVASVPASGWDFLTTHSAPRCWGYDSIIATTPYTNNATVVFQLATKHAPFNALWVNGSFGDGEVFNESTLTDPLIFQHEYAATGTYYISVEYYNAIHYTVNTARNPITVSSVFEQINPATDGFMNIKVRDESGQVMTKVFTNTQANITAGGIPDSATSLIDLFVDKQPFYFGGFAGINGDDALGWHTGATDPGTGSVLYPAGTYTVWSETTLSHMKDNYKHEGADYSGKTVSNTVTVTLGSDTVKISANKETVIRSKPFSVTVIGKPLTTYVVWVKGTNSMSGGYDDQPPMIGLEQDQVYMDVRYNTTYPIGAYAYQNAGTATVRSDVATDTAVNMTTNSTRYYALIKTSSTGTRTVGFVTSASTKDQQYTIKVSADATASAPLVNPNAASRDYKEDEVSINVVRGAVTITASGDQNYYLGEEIKFSGTNTETQTTYLFLTGPNLYAAGSQIANTDPRRSNTEAEVINNDASTFKQVSVNSDNTWTWKWGTASYALDAGTYTIYAVSGPNDADHLGNVVYGTVAIVIKKPFISATGSQAAVAQGDKLLITGTAEGNPQQGIAIWILGKNYGTRQTQSVASDASFSYEVTTADTAGMDAGQYFVVAQHPMQNQQFDINICQDDHNKVCNLQQGTSIGVQAIFTFMGAGSLQGTDAAEALVQAINSPNVDDTYTKITFLVEVPAIRLAPIGDRHVGDKFTITGTTNLAVDDAVLFTVVSSSFRPTQKSQSGEFSGASGTATVRKGDAGMNVLSFDVDASGFKPDEYIVQADRVLQPKVTATEIFNVLEGSAPTATPTPAPAVATPVPTAVATPVPTPTQPGFGVLPALAGLGAVAFVIIRRH